MTDVVVPASAELTAKQVAAIKSFEQLDAWTAARLVPVDQLEFTAWNVNEMTNDEFAELVAEIDEASYMLDGKKVSGFDEPVGVIPIEGEEGRFIVPSGEHRTRAGIACGLTHIPCVLKIHLTEKDKDELEMWSVKRNNVRGRINANRYAALEQGWSKRKNIRAEAARERCLIKGDNLKRLRKTLAVQANEEGGGSADMGGEGLKGDTQKPKGAATHDESDDAAPFSEDAPESSGAPSAPAPPSNPKEEARQRKKLEAGFKAAWEECLMDSADTVEHGYLVFAKDGKTSAVIDTPKHLHSLLSRAIAACKGESAKLNELFTTALTNELKNWEDH